MAKSSIFRNYTITDRKSAKRFLEVLEKAEKQPRWEPSEPIATPLRDHDAIRALVAKRKKPNS